MRKEQTKTKTMMGDDDNLKKQTVAAPDYKIV